MGDKILLPLFLEVNGFLDLLDIDLESDPLEHSDVVVRYSHSQTASTKHLPGEQRRTPSAKTSSQLSETELVLYHRLHNAVREGACFWRQAKS